jgi:hypothetical protein
MNRTALYSTVYRVRNLTRTVSKIFTWLFGAQLAILFVLASGADASLTHLAAPGLRFASMLAVFIFVPRIFDVLLRKIASPYRHA